MATCVPVKDMKSTADFTALVERERDVTVTKNGYAAIHCLSNEEYALIQDELAKAKLLSRILLAENEIADSEYRDYYDFAESIRDEYGL